MDGIEAEFKMQQNSFDKIPFRQFLVYIDSTSLIFLAQYWVVTKQKKLPTKIHCCQQNHYFDFCL